MGMPPLAADQAAFEHMLVLSHAALSMCLWAKHRAQIDPTVQAWGASVHVSAGLHTCKFSMNAIVFYITCNCLWISLDTPYSPHHELCFPLSLHASRARAHAGSSCSTLCLHCFMNKCKDESKSSRLSCLFRGIGLSSSWISCTTPWELTFPCTEWVPLTQKRPTHRTGWIEFATLCTYVAYFLSQHVVF